MTENIKYMPIKDFVDGGYLQEVNRRLLHPLGLALEVKVDETTQEMTLGGVWDYRGDPEGIRFDELDLFAKAELVRREIETRRQDRKIALGYWVQPAINGSGVM